jgi:hypothetical protein
VSTGKIRNLFHKEYLLINRVNNKNKTPMRLTSKSIRIRKRISVVVVSNKLFNMATFFILKALPW